MNNKGIGLIEVLMASGIGLMLILMLAKSSNSQLRFTKAIQSIFDEQDLSYALGKVLTNDISCKANLKPSRLNNGDMTELIQGLDDPDVDDMSLIKVNTDFKNLGIVKMSLSGSGDPKMTIVGREMTVYFKRKGVINKDSKPCDSSDTTGCYTTSCFLKYKVENKASPKVTICDVQTCAGNRSDLSGINCNNSYLTGFDEEGKKICKNLSDLWSCPTGEDVRGFDSSGNVICGDSNALCGNNEYLQGYDSNGKKVCKTLVVQTPPPPQQQTQTPPPPQQQQQQQPPLDHRCPPCNHRQYKSACNIVGKKHYKGAYRFSSDKCVASWVVCVENSFVKRQIAEGRGCWKTCGITKHLTSSGLHTKLVSCKENEGCTCSSLTESVIN